MDMMLCKCLMFFVCLHYGNARVLHDAGQCERDWKPYGGHCYRFESQTDSYLQTRDWYGARDWCELHQSDLVTIETKEENKWLYETVGSRQWHSFWIGYTDMRKEGTWLWQSGSSSTFTEWKNNEPNNAGNEDCAKMYYNSQRWEDANCRQRNGFICEKKQVTGQDTCPYQQDVCSCIIDKTGKTVRCNSNAMFEYKKTPHFPAFTQRLYIRGYKGLYLFNHSFAHMKDLEILDLGDTSIFAFPANQVFRTIELPTGVFDGLKNLKQLFLTNVRLDQLTANKLMPLSNLEDMYISSNQIKTILPGAFHGLGSLRKLFVNKGQVDKIPAPLQFIPLGENNTILCGPGTPCYINCISPSALNYPREYLDDLQPDEFTLRFFTYDLANLQNDIPQWTNLKKVTVYADSLRLESDLVVNFQLVLIARELYIKQGFDFYLPVDGETQSINFYPCGNEKNDVILQTSKVISHSYCPMMPIDPHFAKAMLTCVTEHVQSSNQAVSDKNLYGMLSHIINITRRHKQQECILNEALELRETVSNRDPTEVSVPFLSLQSHDKYLALYQDYAQRFDTELDVVLAKLSQREQIKKITKGQTAVVIDIRQGELKALEGSLEGTKGLIHLSNDAVKEAARQWKTSAKALKGFYEKYKVEKAYLNARRVEFEAGIKKHFTEEIAVGVVNVLGAVGSVFFGGFDLEAIKDAAESAVKLKRLARVIKKLSKITLVATKLTEIFEQTYPLVQMSLDASSKPWELGGMKLEDWATSDPDNKTTAVDVLQWDELTIAADAYMGVGVIATVYGSEEYRIALSKTALWGKAHTSAILKTRDLFASFVLEVNKRESYKQQLSRIEQSIKAVRQDITDLKNGKNIDKEQAKKDVQAIFENLAIVKLQRFNVMTSVNSALSSFCRAYYFTYLEECGTLFQPNFGSDLKVLLTKIQEARKRAVINKGKFSPYTPSRFTKTVTLQDKVKSNCTIYSLCPIKFLKEDNLVIFDIPTNHTRFRGSERVRVDEIQVYVKGAKTSSSFLSVWIENVGKLRDHYNGKDYYFSTVPITKRFKYNIINGNIETHANINTDDHSYTATTPFTVWTLTVRSRENPGLNLTNVDRVEIVFKGTSIEKRISRQKTQAK